MTIHDGVSDYEGVTFMEDGRIPAEDFITLIQEKASAEYEAAREASEALVAKKKIAYDELIALGVSIPSARLMADYHEEV